MCMDKQNNAPLTTTTAYSSSATTIVTRNSSTVTASGTSDASPSVSHLVLYWTFISILYIKTTTGQYNQSGARSGTTVCKVNNPYQCVK